MTRIRAERFDSRKRVSAIALTLLCWAGLASPWGATSEATIGTPGVSVPAEFVKTLRLPGEGDQILRPTAIFTDRAHGETFVVDSGHNRIVIFDRDGLYRFAFDCMEQVAVPADLVVDSSGFIYVLGTVRSGRILARFDFDGMFLNRLDLDESGDWTNLAIDETDRLYLVDADGQRLVIFDTEGRKLGQFALDSGVAPDDVESESDLVADELLLGDPVVSDDLIYLPVSSLGTVYVLDAGSGKLIRHIGIRGNTPGQLNFPVAVDVSPEGIVAVLDKMRFNVVCYSRAGRFLGEFGGKGYRDGWFYHPSLLSVDGAGKVIVGQIMDNRVQVCAIPQFIHEKAREQSRIPRRGGDVGSGQSGNGDAVATLRTR